MRDSDTASTDSSNSNNKDEKKLTGLYGNKLNSKLNFDYSKSLFWQLLNIDWNYDDYV